MFCRFCGNELPDGANFCTKCGKLVSQQEDYASNMNVGYNNGFGYNPFEDAHSVQKDSDASGILKFSILGLAFACSFYLSILGFIFSIIARVKVRNFISQYGETEGKATVGKHLSLAGLIVSIVCNILLFILLFALIILGLSELFQIDASGIYF